MTEIITNKEQDKLNQQALDTIVNAIDDLLKSQEHVVLAVAGGRSVVGIFKLLATESRVDWSKIHIFMVDERLVPLTNTQSNFLLAKQNFIDTLIADNKLPEANVHPFVFSQNKPNNGIDDYAKELKRYGSKYDIILLGAGEDGHVAALFPDHHSIKNQTEFYLTMDDSPKPPPKRMTASKRLLVNSQYAVILFLGETKRQAYNDFLDDKLNITDCPAKLVKQIKHSYLFTDFL